ncbi:polyprenyl synthetase family protein [Leuconostocaceae bacterium ESL0958]|nr:polyprenyl synthetase family protein [Leuconostocaceae bacterium ESL0958]
MTSFTDFAEHYRPLIDQQLRVQVSQITAGTATDWQEMLTYALLTPGKRLRPLLFLTTLASFGHKIDDEAIAAAAIIEWVHAYSLVHDDLPDMDNDRYRRGQLSVQAKFGPANAILVGDGLLTGAFALLADLPAVTSAQKVTFVQVLSKRAGAAGMVYGQVLDMANHDVAASAVQQEDLLTQIYQKKTADLLQAAALLGAAYQELSAATTAEIARLTQALGLAFQIIDDLDDYAQDEAEGVQSLVHVLGRSAATALLDRLAQQYQQALQALAGANSDFDRHLFTDLWQKIGGKPWA